MTYENIREEELKNKIAQDYFGMFDCTKIIGNVDFCVTLSTENKKQTQLKVIDYKDIDILKKFLGPSGKITPRKRSGLSSKNQRKKAIAVKRSRFMGLIPFIIK